MNLKSYEFQLAIRMIKNSAFLYRDKNVLLEYHFIKNPIFRWLADPFLFEYNGKHYIFAESASRITGKGKLVYSEININNIKKCKWKKCLNKKYHLSFPNIYKKNGIIIMVPESYQDKCVAKYVLSNENNFDSWIKTSEIVSNVSYVDTIAFEKYYVSYDISSSMNSLKLLSANGKILDFVNDIDLSLRPAGKMFINDKNYIFVSQNCKKIYGEGLFFNFFSVDNNKMKIKQFYSIDFNDLNRILNKKDFVGIHTYNFDSKFEIVDVRIERFDIIGLLGKIFEKAKNRFKKRKTR